MNVIIRGCFLYLFLWILENLEEHDLMISLTVALTTSRMSSLISHVRMLSIIHCCSEISKNFTSILDFFSFCSCFSTLICRRVDVFVVVVNALCMDFWSQFLSFPCWWIVNITHYSSAGETVCLWFLNEIFKGYLFYHLSTCTVLMLILWVIWIWLSK